MFWAETKGWHPSATAINLYAFNSKWRLQSTHRKKKVNYSLKHPGASCPICLFNGTTLCKDALKATRNTRKSLVGWKRFRTESSRAGWTHSDQLSSKKTRSTKQVSHLGSVKKKKKNQKPPVGEKGKRKQTDTDAAAMWYDAARCFPWPSTGRGRAD